VSSPNTSRSVSLPERVPAKTDRQMDKLAESADVDPEYQMPDIGEAEYLVSALSEVGEGKISDGRLTSIDWVDIKAWIDVTGAEISPGEAEALRMLSSVYVSQYYEAMEKGCPSPNIEKLKDREVIASKVKSMFAMLRG